MFSAGTRVYACSSAVTGKKLGPKRHSLGYISDSNEAHYISHISNFPIKNQSFILVPLKIVFTRYGREKKQRCEAREFLQILPVIKEKRDGDAISKLTKQIISIFNDNELTKNTRWRALCSSHANTTSHFGTVLPVGCAKASRMEGEEVNAWLSSILRNRLFSSLIRGNRDLSTLKSLVGNNDLLIWISNAVSKGKTRQDLITWANEHPGNMHQLIETIQNINTTFTSRMLNNNIKDGEILLKGSLRTNSYLTWITDRMFDDKEIITKKINIVQKTVTSSNLINFAKNLEYIRSEYLNLKPKYV